MHGDFSRLTFNRTRHYSSVLYQQGRPALDADANEQASILLNYQRTLAADLLGPYAGPDGDCGFNITVATNPSGDKPDLVIGSGRYYVGGILVECEAADKGAVTYYGQPDAFFDPKADEDVLPKPPYLVYLRVFEHLVTADDEPALRESALGPNGPDTTARRRVVWQVLATTNTLPAGADAVTQNQDVGKLKDEWERWETGKQDDGRGTLSASVGKPSSKDAVCIASPDAGYRGLENQLYRVEVHLGSKDGKGGTFVWSRDNGTAVFPIQSVDGADVKVTTLGRDRRLGLEIGDWVEVVDADVALRPKAQRLYQVKDIDTLDLIVTLDAAPPVASASPRQPTLLRRWDQQPAATQGAADPADGLNIPTDGRAVELEDGIMVKFEGENYRTGDYWLIAARTATGNVTWPDGSPASTPLPPMGVDYRYAPLALVKKDGVVDLRNRFARVAYVTTPST